MDRIHRILRKPANDGKKHRNQPYKVKDKNALWYEGLSIHEYYLAASYCSLQEWKEIGVQN